MITIKKIITILSISIIISSLITPLNAAMPFFNKNKQETVEKEKEKDNKKQQEKQGKEEKAGAQQSKNDVVSSYIADEISFELKKLKAELKHAKNEIRELKAKSEVWTNPLSIYNKEIILNNGTTVFGKIVYQDKEVIKAETLIGY